MSIFIKIAKKTTNLLLYRFRYLINYIIIGLLSIIIELIIISGLKLYLLNFIATIIGFLSGMFFAFVLNAKLNFNVPKLRNTSTFIAFSIISTIAFILNLILINILENFIKFDYGTLRLISAGAIFLISYTFHRKITFDFIKKVGIAVYLNRGEDILDIYSKIRYYADFIHLDLIDKTINPNATIIDLSLIKKIDHTWGLKKMLHIMSKEPSRWIKYLSKNVDIIIFHVNIEENIENLIKLCKINNKKVGLALSHEDDISILDPYLGKLDFVQIMGIKELGVSGQPFMIDSLEKLKKLNKIKKKYNFEIVFDGGVKSTNVHKINSKYVVASSGLLTSKNPIKSFMELKTSSRYYSIDENIKEDIKDRIASITKNIDFIESSTITGSFSDKDDLSGISDIDTVIITDSLTKKKFDYIISKFEELKKELESKYGYKVIINPTFGPLKFNDKNIVFHVMIYDKESHRNHCIKSPFTCYDWQRSTNFFKKHMSKIYQVKFLQPNYFLNSRRSAIEYSEEIKSNKISYREYIFKNNELVEEKKYKELDNKHKVEYSYHIIKFLITNLLKIYYKENKRYELNSMIKKYLSIFPKNKYFHMKQIKKLYKTKKNNQFSRITWILPYLEIFLKDFEKQFNNYFHEKSKELYFIRHYKTPLNKSDLFIGRKSDVDIIKTNKKDQTNISKDVSFFISSPSKRCQNTLKSMTNKIPIIDERLNEIDYGELDGKDLSFLLAKYPYIAEKWELGEDPKFPKGENYLDVIKRIKAFLIDVKKIPDKKFLICTHNVIIRILIGMSLKIHFSEWHKIVIPHGDPIKFILTKDNRIYIELSPEQNEIILKNL